MADAPGGAPKWSIEGQRKREARLAARRGGAVPAAAEVLGGVPVLRVRGSAPGSGVVVLAHGGGYVTGAPELALPLAAPLAELSGRDVLLPRYRLAPEHAAPAAAEDVAAVLAAVADVPGGVVAAGCSAGAGLTVAAVCASRGQGTPPLRLLLMSPWVDLRLGLASVARAGEVDLAVSRAELELGSAAYRGARSAADPVVSPVLGDLAGLPPTLVQVGMLECLEDDSLLLAARLAEAGVATELRRWPDMIHNWQFFLGSLPEARASVEEAATWCREGR